MQFFVARWIEVGKSCLKNLAQRGADQLDWLHRPLTSRQVRQTEARNAAADMGHVYNDDPGVFPAHNDFWSGVLYWAREQAR
jgi:hypothetical protein